MYCYFFQQTKSFTVDLRAKPEYHKFLIGKGGGNIRKVRDNTGARIIFPTNEDKDQELITIMGTEEAVKEAQKELEVLIRNLVRVMHFLLYKKYSLILTWNFFSTNALEESSQSSTLCICRTMWSKTP